MTEDLPTATTPLPDVAPADDIMFTNPMLARRYNVSDRTISRWEDDPKVDLPPPLIINGRRYRPLSTLQIWERRRAARQQTTA
jgi:hypothetical protein